MDILSIHICQIEIFAKMPPLSNTELEWINHYSLFYTVFIIIFGNVHSLKQMVSTPSAYKPKSHRTVHE